MRGGQTENCKVEAYNLSLRGVSNHSGEMRTGKQSEERQDEAYTLPQRTLSSDSTAIADKVEGRASIMRPTYSIACGVQ
jgi:hypothetical protein